MRKKTGFECGNGLNVTVREGTGVWIHSPAILQEFLFLSCTSAVSRDTSVQQQWQSANARVNLISSVRDFRVGRATHHHRSMLPISLLFTKEISIHPPSWPNQCTGASPQHYWSHWSYEHPSDIKVMAWYEPDWKPQCPLARSCLLTHCKAPPPATNSHLSQRKEIWPQEEKR